MRAAVLLAFVTGCARVVVIDPEQVPARNARAWTVHQTPRPTPPAPTAPAPPASSLPPPPPPPPGAT